MLILVRVHHACNVLEVASGCAFVAHLADSPSDHLLRGLIKLVDQKDLLLQTDLIQHCSHILLSKLHSLTIDSLFLTLHRHFLDLLYLIFFSNCELEPLEVILPRTLILISSGLE